MNRQAFSGSPSIHADRGGIQLSVCNHASLPSGQQDIVVPDAADYDNPGDVRHTRYSDRYT